jgi:CheY-like chemotaxis protein
MRLDFNVLWVEDHRSNVESQKDKISSILRKQGFRLSVEFAESVDEATGFLSNSIYGDHIDLILMDYDLGAGKKGDVGVEEVRGIFEYKDIIFYSGQTTGSLAGMIADRQIPGVFTSHRSDLPDVVSGVFENLVRKVLDIDHSRGIVMGATSDIDHMVNVNLEVIFEKNIDKKKELLQFVKDRVKDKKYELLKALDDIEKIEHYSQLFEHHSIYTSDDRFRLLLKVLKSIDLHQSRRGDFDKYREEIVPKRNILGHVRVVRDGFSRKLYDKKGTELTVESMRLLRSGLLDFQELFEELFPNQ